MARDVNERVEEVDGREPEDNGRSERLELVILMRKEVGRWKSSRSSFGDGGAGWDKEGAGGGGGGAWGR